MNEEKKGELIQEINENFRAILSYGHEGLTPVGEFIVTDIIEPEVDIEYSDFETIKRLARIVLSNVKDKTTQIELPLETFLNECIEKGKFNSKLLKSELTENETIEEFVSNVEEKIIYNENISTLKELNLISLEDYDGDYIDSNGSRSDNYSICPIILEPEERNQVKVKNLNTDFKKKDIEEDEEVKVGFRAIVTRYLEDPEIPDEVKEIIRQLPILEAESREELIEVLCAIIRGYYTDELELSEEIKEIIRKLVLEIAKEEELEEILEEILNQYFKDLDDISVPEEIKESIIKLLREQQIENLDEYYHYYRTRTEDYYYDEEEYVDQDL